ncbi:MAG: tetratricopeptide repeat protein [Candidatus Krumholzibacteriota bacterium]|nr:tetratricopeptide repeat protein [Candidatus Krumholzibacteriota bacterium]
MRRASLIRMLYCAVAVLCLLAASPVRGRGENSRELAMRYYLNGSYAEAQQDLIHAYAYYSHAYRYQPENGRIQLALARVTFDMRKYDEARRHAQALIDSGQYATKARLILAELEYREGDKKKAAQLLEKIRSSQEAPELEVLKFLARIYLELGKTDDAQRAFEEARIVNPDDLTVNYRLGFIYAEKNEMDKAISSLRRAVEANPGIASAHLALGSILDHAGRTEEAKESYRTVLSLEPDNDNALKELIDLYLRDQQYQEGIELLEPLYLENKLTEGSKIILGRLYYRLERFEDALGLFSGLLDSTQDKPTMLRVISEIELERGHFLTASGYLKELIEIEPGKFANYIGLLLIAHELAGPPSDENEVSPLSQAEGRYYLKEAVKRVDANSSRDNYVVGTIYRKIGDTKRALHFLLKAEKLEPGDQRTLLELATVFEDRSEFDEALERIERVYQADPDDPSVNNFYGYLLAEKGARLDFAEELLRKALSREPENGYFLDSLGWIKFRQGEFQEAADILLKATGAVADDAVIWEHLGDAYEKLNLPGKSQQAYDKSISIDPDRLDVQEKLRKVKEQISSAEKTVD